MQAQKDYTQGRPCVYVAGGYLSSEPGIPESRKSLVRNLPRNWSMAGCTNPLVVHSEKYAAAYNAEIISLMSPPAP
jgi:hypothetical protein